MKLNLPYKKVFFSWFSLVHRRRPERSRQWMAEVSFERMLVPNFFMDSIIGTIQSSDWMFWKWCNIVFSFFHCRRMQKFDQKSSWVWHLLRWSISTAWAHKNSQPRIVKINWFIGWARSAANFYCECTCFDGRFYACKCETTRAHPERENKLY